MVAVAVHPRAKGSCIELMTNTPWAQAMTACSMLTLLYVSMAKDKQPAQVEPPAYVTLTIVDSFMLKVMNDLH
jgi:hypothetical protein